MGDARKTIASDCEHRVSSIVTYEYIIFVDVIIVLHLLFQVKRKNEKFGLFRGDRCIK
jgi:hypothetical protein